MPDTGAGLPQDPFLQVTVTLDLGLKDASGNPVRVAFQQPFACRMVPLAGLSAGGIDPCPKRAGYRFAGYWRDDGTCVYGPDGKPTMVMSPYVEDCTLRARWEVDGSILEVTSADDGASTLDVYGNTAVTLRDAVAAARAACPGKKIEIEVDTFAQLRDALEGAPDWILLDNFRPARLRRAVALCRGKAKTEASGGITLATLRAHAETGVDAVSLGALTHSARAVDIALDFR